MKQLSDYFVRPRQQIVGVKQRNYDADTHFDKKRDETIFVGTAKSTHIELGDEYTDPDMLDRGNFFNDQQHSDFVRSGKFRDYNRTTGKSVSVFGNIRPPLVSAPPSSDREMLNNSSSSPMPLPLLAMLFGRRFPLYFGDTNLHEAGHRNLVNTDKLSKEAQISLLRQQLMDTLDETVREVIQERIGVLVKQPNEPLPEYVEPEDKPLLNELIQKGIISVKTPYVYALSMNATDGKKYAFSKDSIFDFIRIELNTTLDELKYKIKGSPLEHNFNRKELNNILRNAFRKMNVPEQKRYLQSEVQQGYDLAYRQQELSIELFNDRLNSVLHIKVYDLRPLVRLYEDNRLPSDPSIADIFEEGVGREDIDEDAVVREYLKKKPVPKYPDKDEYDTDTE